MAPKTSWHRYGNKLRYCHPICKWSWTDKPTQTDRQTDTLITILRARNRGRTSLIVETCSSSRDALSVRFADRSSSSKDRTKLYGCQRNMLSVGKQLAMKSATNTKLSSVMCARRTALKHRYFASPFRCIADCCPSHSNGYIDIFSCRPIAILMNDSCY